MAFMMGCEKIGLEFATKKVFEDLTVGVNDGDRIGIVGRNGDGKSTLLRLLAHEIEPDTGQVTCRRGVRIGMLGQTDALDSNQTVEHEVVGDTPEYEWASDARTRSIIAGLIADVDWHGKVGELSGGQRRRVDLARLLIGDWDALLLDEPTNHLDMRAISWLAGHLKSRWRHGEGALLVVTHDRWFLDEVCLNMWEVHDATLTPFEGGFSAYIQQRVERQRIADVTEQRRQNELRKELAWLSRGARARATKPKFHVAAAQALIAEDPPLRDTLELKRLSMQRLGKQVVDLTNVTVRFGNRTVLDHVDWTIGPGDRFGLLGENGAGKTTMLRLICGDLKPTSGFVKIGKTVQCAVLSQRLHELEPVADDFVRTVLKRCKQSYVVDGKETSPRELLERMGFERQQLNSRVKDLSGGQKRRLQLLLVLLEEPNVLILDEPGNDMDTDMLAVMEDLLDAWPGTLVMVSHDRYLMERVTDNQYALIDGHIRHMPGGVDEYLRLIEGRSSAASSDPHAKGVGGTAASASAQKPKAQNASGLSNAELHKARKELSSLERRIATQERKLAEARQAMTEVDVTDYVALEKQQQAIAAIQDEKDGLEMEWLELSEKIGE
ncbi:MAG: ABC-F family ATP-binding cassette domain-containing protein [Eggerthellaceae bacterium]|jgi:ATP-binding cassette subfamily F protein uup